MGAPKVSVARGEQRDELLDDESLPRDAQFGVPEQLLRPVGDWLLDANLRRSSEWAYHRVRGRRAAARVLGPVGDAALPWRACAFWMTLVSEI